MALLLSSGAQMTRKTSFPLKSPWGPSRTLFNSSTFLPSLGSEVLCTNNGCQCLPNVSTGCLWCFHGPHDSREGVWPLWRRRSPVGMSAWYSQVRGKVQVVLLPDLSPSPSCTFSRVQSMGSRQLLCIRGPHLPGLHLLRDLISSPSVTFTARHSACIRWSVNQGCWQLRGSIARSS